MQIIRPYIIAVLALGVSTLGSSAQTPTPPPSEDQDQGHRPPPPPLIEALDADHNGTISAAEISNAPTALLTLDKNKDGALTQEELRPPRPPMGDKKGDQGNRPPRPPMGDRKRGPGGPGGPGGDSDQGPMHRPPPMPLMMALDTDKDHSLSAEEIAKSPESLKTLDKNKDGSLTREELRPPRPPMHPKDGDTDDDGNPPQPPDEPADQ